MPLAQIVLVVVAFGLTIATLIYKYRVGKKRKVDDAPERRIASVLFAFSLASALLGGALSIISLKLPEPMILPCDGMLTEEHPAIELHDLGGAAAFVATDSYYGSPAHGSAASRGMRGACYTWCKERRKRGRQWHARSA